MKFLPFWDWSQYSRELRRIIIAVSSSMLSRQLAYTGLLLGKKSRLSGRILRIAEIAQADTN